MRTQAIRFRVSQWARSRALAIALLAVVVAVLVGLVLATAAGARRTSTAPDRYTAARDDLFDAIAQQNQGPRSPTRSRASRAPDRCVR